MCGTIHITLR